MPTLVVATAGRVASTPARHPTAASGAVRHDRAHARDDVRVGAHVATAGAITRAITIPVGVPAGRRVAPGQAVERVTGIEPA